MTASSTPVVPLTPTQQHVLELMAEGNAVAEICAQIYRSPGSVKRSMSEIYERLGARNAQHAVHIGHLRGLLGEDGAK